MAEELQGKSQGQTEEKSQGKERSQGEEKLPEEPQEYFMDVRVPKERIAVIIGTKGQTKKEIEEETKCKISVNSETGVIGIRGYDAFKVYQAKDVITAIARGFSPEKALLLLKPDYALEIINLKEMVRSKNQIKRIKGRIIGEKGKSRRTIENLTDTFISVYGKTVSIIGCFESIGFARQAIMMLINGSPHSRVYSWLEKKAKQLRQQEMLAYDWIKDKKDEE